jgi:hypothetical protein
MTLAEALNTYCLCQTLDPVKLKQALETSACHPDWVAQLAQTHPHLFSQTAVFMSGATLQAIKESIAAIERVVALPAYQQAVLAYAPERAQRDFGPSGVFMGYDFHLSPQGPQLIEINTNAGGAFLNAALLQAQWQCCGDPPASLQSDGSEVPQDLSAQWAAMFRLEWQQLQSSRSHGPLQSVLIVDDNPHQQYLAPEFDLACHLFRSMGCQAAVGDARECVWQDGQLRHPALDGTAVQLVYNRLTDFDLSDPSHQALAQAYESGTVAFSPHPRAHALYADKRNLILLSDPQVLNDWGVAQSDCELLKTTIPLTRSVTPQNERDYWQDRKHWFFKPFAGYGSKGAYRGDKVTKGVWASIAQGGMIAQALVPPAERMVDVDGMAKALKFDVRAYVYQGQVQLLAARSYVGQTTNFRTEGGGFLPVLVL